MNCRTLRSRIVRYLDGETSLKSVREIEDHLTRCEACRVEVEDLRALRREWTGLPAPASDPTDREAILLAARALATDGRRTRRSWVPPLRWADLVTASALAAAVLLGWTYLNDGSAGKTDRRSWTVLSLEEVRAREAGRPLEPEEPLTIQWTNRSANE